MYKRQDLHGIYKPTGLQRTYPNVLNFEGVYGLENVKWAPDSVDQQPPGVIEIRYVALNVLLGDAANLPFAERCV